MQHPFDFSLATQLLQAAQNAAQNAYVPYSDFPVGAALLTVDGEIVTGANVENGSYGLTLCAERCAIVKAVSNGQKRFTALAVWAKKRPNGSITPCGACRQVMVEFLKPETPVVMADVSTGKAQWVTMAGLLPGAFTFEGPTAQ